MKKIIFAFLIFTLCLTGCQKQKPSLPEVKQPNEVGGGQNQFFSIAPSVTKQDEYYYYIPNDDALAGIYRCKAGEKPVRLVKGGYSALQVQNTRLYAFEAGFKGGNLPGLLVFNLDGTPNGKLLSGYTLRDYLIYKDHIYFTTDDRLYRCSLDGSNVEMLIAESALAFYICGDMIYYSNTVNVEQSIIKQYNIKEKQEKLLYQSDQMFNWCMWENDLYIIELTDFGMDTIMYIDVATEKRNDKILSKDRIINLQADHDYLWILTENNAIRRYSKQTNQIEDIFDSDANITDVVSMPDGIYVYYKSSSYKHHLNISKLS